MTAKCLQVGLIAMFSVFGMLAFSVYLFQTELWANFKAWLDEEEDYRL